MNYIKVLFSLFVLLLLVLCSFFVSYYSSMSVFKILDIPELNNSAYVFSWFSGGFSSVIPIFFFLFYGITINLMMQSIFEISIKSSDIFFAVSIGLIPLLLYQYFFWFNLIMYSPDLSVISVDSYFEKIDFLFNLSFKQVRLIGDICYLLFFPITTLILYQSCRQKLIDIILAVCIPSVIVALCYIII